MDDRRYTMKDIAETISSARIVEARLALRRALDLDRQYRPENGSFGVGAREVTLRLVCAARRRVERLKKAAERERSK